MRAIPRDVDSKGSHRSLANHNEIHTLQKSVLCISRKKLIGLASRCWRRPFPRIMDDATPSQPFSCPNCKHCFQLGGESPHGDLRPLLFPACGHTVCSACSSARASALASNIPICSLCPDEGGPPGRSNLAILAILDTAGLEPGQAAECEVCLGADDHTPALNVCVGCKGRDRYLCGPHSHSKHARLISVADFLTKPPAGELLMLLALFTI